MAINIYDHKLPDLTHDLYDVTFFDDEILTLVTDTPSYVDSWISETKSLYRHRVYCHSCIQRGCFQGLMVGLDIEWRPNFTTNSQNPVAVLQLCVGRRCLIFQIIHSPFIPISLINFLGNINYTFVGVGIKNDVEKLREDYDLVVANAEDLREMAAKAYDERELCNIGLKDLARRVLGKEVNKPKRITMSKWDEQRLSPAQVQYACIDAFLSLEIGKILI